MAITVRELIDHLQEHVQANGDVAELEVWLSGDPDGNRYQPTSGDFDIFMGEGTEVILEREVTPGIIILYPSRQENNEDR